MTGPAGEHGQATAELALVLPFVVVLALLVVQVGVLAQRQVLVVHAAREGARAAAVVVEGDDVAAAARSGAERSTSSGPRGMEVVATLRDGHVDVEVTITEPTDVALVGRLLPDVALRGHATMRWEGGR